MERKNNMWWGYQHISGEFQVKRYLNVQSYLDAYDSDFVQKVFMPFDVPESDKINPRQYALNHIKSMHK